MTYAATSISIPIPTSLPKAPKHDDGTFNHPTELATTVLTVVAATMLLSAVIVALHSRAVEKGLRAFHHISFAILVIAGVAYMAMASGLGAVTFHGREVFVARYVDWSLTTPLLLLDLSLLSGASYVSIVSLLFADVVMIVTGTISPFGKGASLWTFFAISCFFLLIVVKGLVYDGLASARLQSASVHKLYVGVASFTILLWSAYPIVFALSEGTRRISIDAEVIAYAVLDVLAKPIFIAWLLIAASSHDSDTVPFTLGPELTENRGAFQGLSGADN